MRRIASLVLLLSLSAFAQQSAPDTSLKSLLLEELRNSHNKQDWYATANSALDGVTAQQATWKDGSGNHSIGQLANHLLFWDARALQKFTGKPQAAFSGNNDETFNAFDSKNWAETVKKLDQVMTEWEQAVEAADEKKLRESATTILHIAAHNAYHVGQIVYIRKLQGSWNPDKGVK